MELRLLTPDDATAFRELRLAALQQCPTAFTADYATELSRPLSHFAAQIRTLPDNFIVGAFQDLALAGIAGFYRSEGAKLRHKGNIWGMYVAPDLRGSGAGRRILEDIIARAFQLDGIIQIHLSVVADNQRARSLYLASGFKSLGLELRAIQVDGRFYDDERMVLMLRGAG